MNDKAIETREGKSEPTPMANRPPVRMICYTSVQGNPHEFSIGRNGVTVIRETEECAEYSTIPWLEVWEGETLVARFNQHKLEHIFYKEGR